MAKQIQSFGMSAMTIGACSNFHTTAVKYINEATPAVLHIEDKSPAYSESSDTLASIVNRKRAFITTPQMRSADKTRDAALGAISSVVNALVTSPVDERRSAAELLSQQLSPYRGIRAHEYNKETAGPARGERRFRGSLRRPQRRGERNGQPKEHQFSRRRSRSEPPLPGNRTDGERLRHCAAHRRAERLHRQDERLGRLAGKRIGQQH